MGPLRSLCWVTHHFSLFETHSFFVVWSLCTSLKYTFHTICRLVEFVGDLRRKFFFSLACLELWRWKLCGILNYKCIMLCVVCKNKITKKKKKKKKKILKKILP